MTTFTIALAQIPVIGGQPVENLRCAVEAIARAAAAGATIVLLPEALDCGWCHSSALTDAGPIPDGPACQQLLAAAKFHHLYVRTVVRDAALRCNSVARAPKFSERNIEVISVGSNNRPREIANLLAQMRS